MEVLPEAHRAPVSRLLYGCSGHDRCGLVGLFLPGFCIQRDRVIHRITLCGQPEIHGAGELLHYLARCAAVSPLLVTLR